MKPAYKQIRVVALLGLIVMTTTMAASPVREALLPLLSRPLARLNLISAPAPVAVTADVARSAVTPRADGRLTPLSPPDYVAQRSTAAQNAVRFDAEPALRPRAGALAQAWAEETWLAAAAAESRGSRFDVGPWRPGAGSSPARAGSASLRRLGDSRFGRAQRRDFREWLEERNANVRNGNGSSTGNGSGSGRGSSGGGSSSSPADPGAVLGEYKQGLPELNGSNGINQAGTLPLGGLANVASTPEPSALLLFGTGILAAGGALRRRLRRAR